LCRYFGKLSLQEKGWVYEKVLRRIGKEKRTSIKSDQSYSRSLGGPEELVDNQGEKNFGWGEGAIEKRRVACKGKKKLQIGFNAGGENKKRGGGIKGRTISRQRKVNVTTEMKS